MLYRRLLKLKEDTQRLAAVEITDQLPRSAIGKVLKRELRDQYVGSGKVIA